MAGDNAGDPIRCAIAEQVASLPVIERAVRADADDAVHQLRVSIRRIRSLLRAVPGGSARLDEGEPKLGPPHEHSGSARLDEGEAKLGPPHEHRGSARLDDELRWLAGVLGTARDAEVLAQRYRRALHRIAPSLVRGRVAERLVDAAAQRYRAGWAQSVAALDSPRHRRLLAGLETVAAGQSTA
ncbi:CHAD domain-containing protein, partial [Mycolicibacter algericus]|uniref:CHAD domain-containing protein n=1 Tax=Mycolicibacter algericus TaxID=1288388 RepID=UPI003C73DD47